MTDMTLSEALALANQDCPLPVLAGKALKVLRARIMQHPHCDLRITRSLAPGDKWHWSVNMPDGRCWRAAAGFVSQEDCVASARIDGVEELNAADTRWRLDHPTIPKDC